MDEGKLICLVQNNEGLYNKMCNDFKNKQKKQELWIEIGKAMGVTRNFKYMYLCTFYKWLLFLNKAAVCERRWTSLRDRFNKEVQKTDGPSGSGATMLSNWPHFDSMSFLRGHLLQRKQRSNFGTPHGTESVQQDRSYVYECEEWLESERSFAESSFVPITQLTSKQSPVQISSQAASRAESSFAPITQSTLSPVSISSPAVSRAESLFAPITESTLSPVSISSPAVPRARKRKCTESDDSIADATSAFLQYVQKTDLANPMASACGKMVTAALSAMGPVRLMEKVVVITQLLEKWAKESEEITHEKS